MLTLCGAAGLARAADGEPRLPPIAPAEASARVRGFRFLGNRAFGDEELARVLAPFTGRQLSSEELLAARDALTRHYVEAGYVTSGARIPDQVVRDGIVALEIVEGELEGVDVQGAGRSREYVRSRLEHAARGPLDAAALEGALRLLQEDGAIGRIDAELVPTGVAGRARLRVAVEEAPRFSLEQSIDNQRSAALGGEGVRARAALRSALAAGDVLQLELEAAHGLFGAETYWALPLGGSGSALELGAAQSRAEVVQSPFDDLDVESEYGALSLALRHPLWRSADSELWLGLAAERRRGETWLLGSPFSFAPGADDGESSVSVLRAVQEGRLRGSDWVLAARSALTAGFDVLGATQRARGEGTEVPDSRFLAWLGQVQAVRRLPEAWRSAQLVARLDLQIALDPLHSLEQFSIGGASSVRGYRENELVRDNGLAAAVELRIPILTDLAGREILELAPFADLGRAWNETRAEGPRTLASLGLGMRWRATARSELELYWGVPLRDIDHEGSDLQDLGLHFELRTRF
jgi:hemolysin activation/secretion protein